MATKRHIGVADVTYKADVDLTGVQYYFVTAASTAGNVKVATGASNPAPLGVLQNSPSLGQEARLSMLGPTKVFAVTPSTCGIAQGRYVTVNASGQAIPLATESGSPIVGRNIGNVNAPVSASRFIEIFFFGPLSACAVSAS